MRVVRIQRRRINPVLSTKSVERPKFAPIVFAFDWHREGVSAIGSDPEFSGVQGGFAFERLAAETAQLRFPLRSGQEAIGNQRLVDQRHVFFRRGNRAPRAQDALSFQRGTHIRRRSYLHVCMMPRGQDDL